MFILKLSGIQIFLSAVLFFSPYPILKKDMNKRIVYHFMHVTHTTLIIYLLLNNT